MQYALHIKTWSTFLYICVKFLSTEIQLSIILTLFYQQYYGTFCECDNFTCRRHGGLLCSGPDHGICECGTCMCRWEWSGLACECPDKQNCYPNDSAEECMGRGSCVCGVCKCRENYSGKYCEECPVSALAVNS